VFIVSKPDIAFHFNAPAKRAYACRLLRKASAAGARVAVVGAEDDLRRLDAELWTFSALDFVPHAYVHPGLDAGLRETSSVLLCQRTDDAASCDVLVNLDAEIPAGFERFARVIEIVTLDDADRHQARRRWKRYTEQGYTLTRHDLKLSSE
jgi:DNA polymerase III subunit chi